MLKLTCWVEETFLIKTQVPEAMKQKSDTFDLLKISNYKGRVPLFSWVSLLFTGGKHIVKL